MSIGRARTPGLMDFYTVTGVEEYNLYILDYFKWYRLPTNENETVLVISVSAGAARLWLVAYTVLVTLIFMATCELASLVVLIYFKLGKSGTCHAILVSFYNAGTPGIIAFRMVGYLWNALFRCKKSGQAAVDRSAGWASFSLLLLAVSLLSGDLITKFLLGGCQLFRGNIAPVDPSAIYYPSFEPFAFGREAHVSVFNALKGPRSAAVFQATARRTTTPPDILRSRISFHETIQNATIFYNGTTQNVTGASFTYGYNLTGYEMGLRDAPGLVYKVQGKCATYHGQNAVERRRSNSSSQYPTEYFDRYIFYDDETWPYNVWLEREQFAPPFIRLMEGRAQSPSQDVLYGGWAFQLVPSTAWRPCLTNKTGDPWYETEQNPVQDEEWLSNTQIAAPFRVKSGRPPMRCTQNDTYTYKENTVNHHTGLQCITRIRPLYNPDFRYSLDSQSPGIRCS